MFLLGIYIIVFGLKKTKTATQVRFAVIWILIDISYSTKRQKQPLLNY